MTAAYLLILLPFAFLAKAVSASLARAPARQRLGFLLWAPTLSIDTWLRAGPREPGDLRRWALAAAWTFPALVGAYVLLRQTSGVVPNGLRAYLSIVPFWLLTEGLSLALRFPYLVAGIHLPPMHHDPWRSRGLSVFWGRRWSTWFGDWFRQVCFAPLRRHPAAGVALAFATSAGLHELLVNVPLWWVLGKNLMGSMLLYFAIQALGLFLERKFLRPGSPGARCFLWLVVLVPIPWVLNEGTLRIFRFLP